MAAAVLLTDAKLKGMKPPPSGQVEISDAQVPGLRVRMGTSGAQTFIVRKRIGGRLRNITLGRFGQRFTLADARKKARTIISDIEAGRDPSATLATPRRGGKGDLTLRAMLPDYLAAKADKRSVSEMKRILERYVLPELGDRLADAVTRADVTRLIDAIAITAPVQARNVHAQLSSFYTWALPRLERLAANPCRDAGRPPAPRSRDRVLSDAELKVLWGVLDEQPWPWGPAVKMLILTGQRRDEVFSADRAEFDLVAGTWTIPSERAKNGVEHIVPLAPAVAGLIAALPEFLDPAGKPISPKLFPARSSPQNGPSGISKAMERLRKALTDRMGEVSRWSLHDLRRTAATGMQRLGIRQEVTEAVLNHISGSRAGIAGVYQRHHFRDEKRHALEAWAAEVERIVAAKPKGNVVAIRG